MTQAHADKGVSPLYFQKTIDLFTDDFGFDRGKGETRISPMVYGNKQHGFELDDRLSKTAACDEALDFASRIQPIPGARVILVSAMGSSDAWGVNKKGDTFPESGLLGMLPKDVEMAFFNSHKERLPREWGISLFPTKHNAAGDQIGGGNTFHEHNNRPSKLPGGIYGKPGSDVRCGDILAAFWNPRMSRVELIQTVWERKLPHIVRMIDEGFLPGISMACDVPFDRCTICGNLAINDFSYCRHLQRTNGMRGKLLGDKLIAMINDFPLLFDSSIVAHPAAVEGRTLRKIASIPGNPLALAKEAAAISPASSPSRPYSYEQQKLASTIVKLRASEPEFPAYVMDFFRSNGLVKSAKELATVGISLKGKEIGQLLFPTSKTAGLNGEIADAVLPMVLHQRINLELSNPQALANNPVLMGSKQASMVERDDAAQTMRVVGPWIPMRSYAPAIIPGRVAADSSPSRMIDLNQPLHGLSDETKAILLTRILSDSQIVSHLHDVLVRPVILWELQKMGLAGGNDQPVAPESVGILGEMHKGYEKDLGIARAKFFASHPGNS